jgi:hypothetical protein
LPAYVRQRVVARTRQEISINKTSNNNTRDHTKDKKIGHGFALLETHEEKTWPDKTTPTDTREQQGDVSAKVNEVAARETTCLTAMTRLGPVNVRVRVRVTVRVRGRHRVRVCNTDKTRQKIKIRGRKQHQATLQHSRRDEKIGKREEKGDNNKFERKEKTTTLQRTK